VALLPKSDTVLLPQLTEPVAVEEVAAAADGDDPILPEPTQPSL